MKTYYAVTEGEYSDYRIITITEDKEKAKRIAAAYDGDVEEYEDCIINPIGIWKVYHYEKNRNWLVWGDRIFEKCGIRRDEGGDGGKTLEIRGKRRLSARDGGANYQQS